jgi:cytochrome c biogenesis protein CcdA
MPVDLGLVTFALGVGAATFFSPCAAGLLPAYVAFFAGVAGDGDDGVREEDDRDVLPALLEGARFGAAAAAGALALFAVGTLAVYLLRARLGLLDSQDLLGAFTGLGLAVGLSLVGLGVLLLADRAPTISLPLRAPSRRTGPAMAAFGALFALGSMGCTLPVFLGVLGAALAAGPVGGSFVLAAYGIGLSGLLLVASAALAAAEDRAKAVLRRAQRVTKPASGALLVLAGLYVVAYYADVALL